MSRVTVDKLISLCKRVALRVASWPIKATTTVDPNKIVFSAFSGNGYACSPKYILEAVHRADPTIELVWLTARPDASIPSYVRTVTYGTLSMVHELATARVWVDNTRGEKCIRKRPGQFYLQTWHAYCGPKKCERDAPNMSALYHWIAKRDGADTDCMIADNDFEGRLFQTSFWFSGPVVRCGVPRNKPLLLPDPDDALSARHDLGVPRENSICLYAPTFRRNIESPAFSLDYEHLRQSLEDKFGGKFSILVRLHPNERNRSSELPGDVVDASHYPDGQKLISSSDVLISDYSSVIEDFALTGRPGFMFIPDYEDYVKEERGMYYPLTRRPFPLAKTEEELFRAVEGFSNDDLKRRRAEFFDFIGFEDDGHGDEFVAKLILDGIRGVGGK